MNLRSINYHSYHVDPFYLKSDIGSGDLVDLMIVPSYDESDKSINFNALLHGVVLAFIVVDEEDNWKGFSNVINKKQLQFIIDDLKSKHSF